MGPDVLVDVQHMGSTAIPGLSAKPQIDIIALTPDLRLVKAKYEAMKAAGFQPKGDYVGHGEEYFTEDDENGHRLTSLHIVPVGHPEFDAQMTFRDYMRQSPEDRKLYEATKMKLKQDYPDDYNAYGEGKNRF